MSMTPENAEILALEGLGWLAGEEDGIQRFLDQSVLDIATDYLAVGIDPNRSTLFIQSEVPAIDELTFFFAMLLPFNRVMKNPTILRTAVHQALSSVATRTWTTIR